MSDKPKNLDKFMEEYETWKKEQENLEMITVQAKTENQGAGRQIKQMTNIITIVCVTIIVVVTICYIIKRKNH